MKNIVKILSTFIFSVAVVSCSLEEEPYGFLSSDNFYQTEEDALAALTHMYDIMGDIEYYSRYYYYIAQAPTEECYFKDDVSADEKDLAERQTNPNNTILTWMFKAAFIGINRSNAVLENVPDINMSEESRNQILGEAYFMRALHYFNLVRIFGEVPLRKATVSSESDVNAALESIESVYEFIISDLTEAENLMDETFRYARVNKTGAQALLSKVYITMASAAETQVPKYDFVSDPNSYYQLAADYSSEVLSQNVYTFWDGELIDLWDIDNEAGNEFIFSIAFASDGEEEGDYSKLSMLLVPYIDGTAVYLGPDYETLIPDGWSHIKTNMDFYNNFDSIDKRKTDLFVSSVQNILGQTMSIENGMLEYPFSRKHIDKYQSSEQTGKDIPVIRYTDILLIYAEAVGPTAEGYEAVNRIRNRAGLADLPAGLSLADFREMVYEERGYELAFEGHRLFDLRRLHKMEEILVDKYNMTINEDPYFYSIPQSEKDNNGLVN